MMLPHPAACPIERGFGKTILANHSLMFPLNPAKQGILQRMSDARQQGSYDLYSALCWETQESEVTTGRCHTTATKEVDLEARAGRKSRLPNCIAEIQGGHTLWLVA